MNKSSDMPAGFRWNDGRPVLDVIEGETGEQTRARHAQSLRYLKRIGWKQGDPQPSGAKNTRSY